MPKLVTELSWLLGSVAAAFAFCWSAPEYGYRPVPFFSLALYLGTGAARAVVRFVK